MEIATPPRDHIPRGGVVRLFVADAEGIPEHFNTSIRKVEPIGGDVVRLYFAVERGGAWDDQFTLLPKTQLEQAKGVSVYMLKAIINGRGDEVVELAQINLR